MSETEPLKWVTSYNEERWGSSREYSTKEEAIKHAKGELCLKEDDPFWVGTAHVYLSAQVHTDYVLEQLNLDACDLVGDAAEAWPEYSKVQEEELDKALNAVLREWLTRHKIVGNLFYVRDVEKIEPEFSE